MKNPTTEGWPLAAKLWDEVEAIWKSQAMDFAGKYGESYVRALAFWCRTMAERLDGAIAAWEEFKEREKARKKMDGG